jgi:hypothetical protein
VLTDLVNLKTKTNMNANVIDRVNEQNVGLLPQHIPITTHSSFMNNQHFNIDDPTKSIISNCIYNNNIMIKYNYGRKYTPKSFLEQCILDCCAIDPIITDLTRQLPQVRNEMFYLLQWRAQMFYTRSEINHYMQLLPILDIKRCCFSNCSQCDVNPCKMQTHTILLPDNGMHLSTNIMTILKQQVRQHFSIKLSNPV